MSHDQDVPEDVWEQDVAQGGAVDGELPRVAVPTVPQGVATVREVPVLRHITGKLDLTTTGLPLRIGREARRRRLILSVSASATSGALVVLGDTQQQAAAGYGLQVPAGTLMVLGTAAEIWLQTFEADLTVSFLAELDQG